MEEFKLDKDTCLDDQNTGYCQEYQVNSDSDASFVDCEILELAIFELESEYQIVKDICFNRKIPSPGRCSVENCELDHSIISCLLNSDLETDSKSTEKALIRESFISDSSSFFSEHIKHCASAKNSTSARLPLVRKMDTYLSNSNGDRSERKYNKVPIERPISTASESEVETRSNTDDEGPSMTTITTEIMDHPRIKDSQPPFTTINKTHLPDEDHADFSFFAVGPVSGPVTKSGSISFRSNSCNSTRSFTFPALSWEWNDNPERMGEANRRKDLKKHRRWKSFGSLCCTKF